MYILHVLTEDIIFIEDIFVLLLQELSSWPGRRAAAGALIGTWDPNGVHI